jgi:UDP-2,3-diacylglucosamine pyrophosphatase LpxH
MKIKNNLRIIIVLFLSFLFASCKNSNPVNPVDSGKNFFTNGSSERNMIVVISDMHLGADLTYAETNNNLSHLVKFLDLVRTGDNVKELVIAGDLFDEWFVPANINTYQGKDQLDFVQRIAATNKGVFDLFNRIIQDGKITVTYIPGNHDLTITAENVESVLPGIKQARDDMQGLGTYSPLGYSQIAIEHGHRYNYFCAPDPISNINIAPGSIMPPGYFFTRIAALHVVQNCKTAGDTIVTVTPNLSGGESQTAAYIYWNIWKTLMLTLPVENKFKDKIIVTNINGFTETYSISDLMPYQLTAGEYIDCNLYRGAQDNWNQRQIINKVPVNIPLAEAIEKAADNIETDNQAKVQYFMNPNSNKRVVVFGHTHEAKIVSSENYNGLKSVYANSGTWIDRSAHPTTMNFVVITPQTTSSSSQTYVKLFNFLNDVVTQMAADSLRF